MTYLAPNAASPGLPKLLTQGQDLGSFSEGPGQTRASVSRGGAPRTNNPFFLFKPTRLAFRTAAPAKIYRRNHDIAADGRMGRIPVAVRISNLNPAQMGEDRTRTEDWRDGTATAIPALGGLGEVKTADLLMFGAALGFLFYALRQKE
jgi:hypothetical protein